MEVDEEEEEKEKDKEVGEAEQENEDEREKRRKTGRLSKNEKIENKKKKIRKNVVYDKEDKELEDKTRGRGGGGELTRHPLTSGHSSEEACEDEGKNETASVAFPPPQS